MKRLSIFDLKIGKIYELTDYDFNVENNYEEIYSAFDYFYQVHLLPTQDKNELVDTRTFRNFVNFPLYFVDGMMPRYFNIIVTNIRNHTAFRYIRKINNSKYKVTFERYYIVDTVIPTCKYIILP